MTPPMRLGDGTGLSAKGISEIRKGDGTVLWSAGSAIPDSVVLQYYATSWAQGDSTWFDDTDTANISLTGDLQADSLSDGADSLRSDGTDDYGLVNLPTSLEGTSLQAFSVEFAIEYSASGQMEPISVINDGPDQQLRVVLNQNELANSDDGNIQFYLEDDNGDRVRAAPSTNPNLDDGNRHNVSLIVNDSSNNDLSIIIDGTNQSLNYDVTESPNTFTNWQYDCGIFARNDRGSIGKYLDGMIGAIRFHDSAISEQTIGDYS